MFLSNRGQHQYSFELNNLNCLKKRMNSTKIMRQKNNGCGTAPGNLAQFNCHSQTQAQHKMGLIMPLPTLSTMQPREQIFNIHLYGDQTIRNMQKINSGIKYIISIQHKSS